MAGRHRAQSRETGATVNQPHFQQSVALAIPFLLVPSTGLVFSHASRRCGRERGYLLGFFFYWLFWCLAVPGTVLGGKGLSDLLIDGVSLFAGENRAAAGLFVMITLVTVFMYGRGFLRGPFRLIVIAIPIAVLNGFAEELLWRGFYVGSFPHDFRLAVLYPAIGFALWHLSPLLVFSQGSKPGFVLSTFLLGLAYGWIAFETGSAKWTAISHSLNGILALSGMIGPSMLTLLERRQE
jgi:hypothetical protein